jgi:hypothetical protein
LLGFPNFPGKPQASSGKPQAASVKLSHCGSLVSGLKIQKGEKYNEYN